MDPAKIEAIRNWPDLKNVHKVRSFLRLCSYYRRYVRKFGEIASPLHMLTQKGVPFLWGATKVTTFRTLKDKMTTGPILILSDLQKSFEVYCDACGRSLSAVLMQEGRVIAYESCLFSKPEMTAQIYEKELLVVIHALTQWRHYLLGADFTVFTDYQSLRYFLSQKQLSEKQMRWANILSQCYFQIVHVQGQKNMVADALSRKLLVQAIFAIHHRSFEDMVDQYATDIDFADIFTRIRDGEMRSYLGSLLDEKNYAVRYTAVKEKVMTEYHCPPFTSHRGIATTMKGVERYFYWPRLKKDVEEFVRSCLVCQKVKFDRHKAQGMLQPLPIPTRPWESSTLHSTKDKIFEADEYTRDLDRAFAKVRETLQKSQERQKKAAGRHRHDLRLKENDWVLLRFEKARVQKKKGKERLFPKLSMRYYGPFQITERINDVSFRLRLPDTWKIHNAFHVSLLEPFKGDVPDDGELDEQPEVEENEEILVPQQILAHKDTKNKGKVRRRFLVKFNNYPALDAK
ncbi:hypothetical protein L7F22_024087 [Adiantum nelumboides]|nr:hypothetical protein [Adiantum nelumboides]